MRPQRIILVDGSRFLRDVLRKVIEKTPGLNVVSEVSDLESLLIELRKNDIDWVVLSLPPKSQIPEDLKKAVMDEFPAIRILAFYTDGSRIRLERVGQHEKILGGFTWDVLIDILSENDIPIEN